MDLPYSVTKTVQINSRTVDLLKHYRAEGNNETAAARQPRTGGVLADMGYAWRSTGPRLEVVRTTSGARVSCWTFGGAMQDSDTCVSCVAEIPRAGTSTPFLAVGLHCGFNGVGMVCVFDIFKARVLRAVHIPDKVTSIHVVDAGWESSMPGVLRVFDGILAVGTANGNVLLLDLCRQSFHEGHTNDEATASRLHYVSLHDLKHLERFKEVALQADQHLCLQLNEMCTSGAYFILKGQKGDERLHASKDEVAISSLQYCRELGSLLVGYNFGAFQMYNLLSGDMRLEYTSAVYEQCTSITHLAFQEPADDPRAFCYVWALYGSPDDARPGPHIAVMYALAYNSKDAMEGSGHLYQELKSCTVQFQMEFPQNDEVIGSRCISLRTYTKNNVPLMDNTFLSSSSSALDCVKREEHISICAIVSTVWNDGNASALEMETQLYLFDLNQWYKAQMPMSPPGNYLTEVPMTALLPSTVAQQDILDVKLDASTLAQFVSAQRLEEHYFPSALSYNFICACEQEIVWLTSFGQQKHLLLCIEEAGPLCLLKPTDIYRQCIQVGLVPMNSDIPYNTTNSSLNVQRDMILNVALEHQLVSWLCRCAHVWMNDRYASADCTLDSLVVWAWQRAQTLQANVHTLCTPLFDFSGLSLDSNALIQLNCYTRQLKHLLALFTFIVHNCTVFLSKQRAQGIKQQWKSLEMMSVYLEVLQWLVNVGLLPECPLSMYPRSAAQCERNSAPYPADAIDNFYQQRRSQLRRTEQQASYGCPLLFIDNFIELECGSELLRQQWQQTGGGTGLYPPPSLQALLRTYLVDGVSITCKHSLLIYVFLDLAKTLDKSRHAAIITHLIKFPAVFHVSPNIIKVTQALWQLDQGDFSTAIAQLLDPSVNADDLKSWQHRNVLRALLVQGQYQHALLYHQVRKPYLSDMKDVTTVITLLTVNNMLQEAFYFQRHYSQNKHNQQTLLRHFFHVCSKTNHLASIIQLPLSSSEEEAFITYLTANRHASNAHLLVIYYLQRDRYCEAFDLNSRLSSQLSAAPKQGLLAQHDTDLCNIIVQGFQKTLPDVTRTLFNYCKAPETNALATIKRPTPMSVFIHNSEEQAKYKSTLIEASLQKARETWSWNESTVRLDEMPFISTPKIRIKLTEQNTRTPLIETSLIHLLNESEDGNELDKATPTPRKKMKLSETETVPLSLLSTPIVKRRTYRALHEISNDTFENDVVSSQQPPSILKIFTPKTSFSVESLCNETATGNTLTLDVFRLSFKPVVRFEDKQLNRVNFREATVSTPEVSEYRQSVKRKAPDNEGAVSAVKSRPSYRKQTTGDSLPICSMRPKKSLAETILEKHILKETLNETSTSIISIADNQSVDSFGEISDEGSISSEKSIHILSSSSEVDESFLEKFIQSRQTLNVDANKICTDQQLNNPDTELSILKEENTNSLSAKNVQDNKSNELIENTMLSNTDITEEKIYEIESDRSNENVQDDASNISEKQSLSQQSNCSGNNSSESNLWRNSNDTNDLSQHSSEIMEVISNENVCDTRTESAAVENASDVVSQWSEESQDENASEVVDVESSSFASSPPSQCYLTSVSKGQRVVKTRASSLLNEPVTKRRSSTDESKVNSRRRQRAMSVDNVGSNDLTSRMDEYLATHRVTRRQKQLMMLAEMNKTKTATVATEDEPSPPASSSIRQRRKSFTLAEQALSTPQKGRRLRSQRTLSQASDSSGNHSDEPLVRHRSLSPTLLQENKTKNKSQPRSLKRLSKTTTTLPKITEELTTVASVLEKQSRSRKKIETTSYITTRSRKKSEAQ